MLSKLCEYLESRDHQRELPSSRVEIRADSVSFASLSFPSSDYQNSENGFERAKGWQSEIGKAMR